MSKWSLTIACALLATAWVMSGAGPAGAELARLKADPDPIRGGRIVDDRGREIILRGVNVNSLGEYWQGSAKRPTFPLQAGDPGRIARLGWNLVRLIVSWSRVEPRPGQINRPYLERTARWIRRLEKKGIYTVVDFHQDAWGPTLAAPPGEICPPPSQPGFGWDGAPGWATFDDGKARCFTANREVNPAVRAAWMNFFADRPASDGVGIQTHYVRMLRRVARFFARESAVAGIDIMNEPNAFGPAENAALGDFYGRALASVRAGERAGRGFRHLVLFEPGVLWSLLGSGPPGPFKYDPGVVYSPHLYGGSIGGEGPPVKASFQTAITEAAAFGGAPVLTGEWGGDPNRADSSEADYFSQHLALQDEFRIGSALWNWKQSCGDPHAATHSPEDPPPLPIWSVYRLDCSGSRNRVLGQHRRLVRSLGRAYVRKAPGRLSSISFDPLTGKLAAAGEGARRNSGPLEVFLPYPAARLGLNGLDQVKSNRLGSGLLIRLRATGTAWGLRAKPG